MRALIYLAVLLCAFAPRMASAGQGSLIRDTEIEASLRGWLAPVAEAAGMNAGSIRIILIEDPDVNAFVAGGQNIFLYTGLIDKASNAGEVVGVMAHELGHISGGHLVRKQTDIENASYESMIGMILGVGAAIASGQGDALATLSTAGQTQAMRRLYGASRVYESSADQAALSYLNNAGINPIGLLTFMQKLESEELLPASQQSAYMRTHPLTRDRVSALADRISRSPHKDKALPGAWDDQFARMKAKLTGFIRPGQVAWAYDDRDQSIAAQYARVIAAYRQNQMEDALRSLDRLLALEPKNPYFHELKGQILRDGGRVKESVPHYSRALALKPDAPLVRMDMAHAMIESGGSLKQAIQELNRAVREEPRTARAWRLLATAYGKAGDEARAQLALAEEALLRRDLAQARALANAAKTDLPKGSRDAVRAQDILLEADRLSGKNRAENEDLDTETGEWHGHAH